MNFADDRLRLIRIKIERANKHLAELERAVLSIQGPVFKIIGIESNSETNKPFLDSRPLNVYPAEIPAIAGDVVHNLRSALDHLAFQLVSAGGEPRSGPWEDIQFPIAHCPDTYKARKGRRIEGASREAIEAIDRLKPYKGGNEALWLLNKLDNADKHSFVLPMGEDVIVGGVSLYATNPFFTSLGNVKDDDDVDFSSEEPAVEIAVGQANALLPTLHQLAELVSYIVESFRPFLE